MLKSIYLSFVFLLLISCGDIEFTYKDKTTLKNPFFNKTKIVFLGQEIVPLKRNTLKYFGKNLSTNYELSIDVNEKQTRRVVQDNQAVSKLDYELILKYNMYNVLNNCLIYEKEIISRFSYVPKSSGYNFSSDKSLEKLYQVAVNNNLEEFISLVSELDKLSCDNEN